MPKHTFTRREILKLGLWTLLGGGAVSGGGYFYSKNIEPDWLEINPLELRLPNLAPEFDGYRIAQISDIHMDDWMIHRIGSIVDAANQSKPDLIAITGDYVTGNPKQYKHEYITELNRLQAPDGVFGVLGNHDHWTDSKVVRNILRQGNVVELKNSFHTLERGQAKFHICGLDDYWERHADMDKLLKELPHEDCALLMVHEPDYIEISAKTRRFDLQISGHSHGGQVIIPFVGPIVLPTYAEKHPLGIYKIRKTLLYTNRGVGMISPQVRFNCRPEITLFTLRAPKNS